MVKRRPITKLKWTEPKHYPVSERKHELRKVHPPIKDKEGVWIHAVTATTDQTERVERRYIENEVDYKIIKNGNINEIYTLRPKVRPTKAPLNRVSNMTVTDRDGRIWYWTVTVDEAELKRIEMFYKRKGIVYMVLKNGEYYEIYKERSYK